MKMKKILIVVLIVVALIFLSPIILGALWFGGMGWSNAHPVIGENMAKVDWLPAVASNVSFYKTYLFTAYEFDISEADFVALGRERDWKLAEINDKSLRVKTYRMGDKLRDRFPIPKSDISTDKQIYEYLKARQVIEPIVTNGLAYEVRQANCGGITAVYDRTKQRAYVQANPR
jgi:hypothetical protein